MAMGQKAITYGLVMTLFGGLMGCSSADDTPNPSETGTPEPTDTVAPTETVAQTTQSPTPSAPAPTPTAESTETAVEPTDDPTPTGDESAAPTATQAPSPSATVVPTTTPAATASLATPSPDSTTTPGQSTAEPSPSHGETATESTESTEILASESPQASPSPTPSGQTPIDGSPTQSPDESPSPTSTDQTPGDESPGEITPTPTLSGTPATGNSPTLTIVSPRDADGAASVSLSGQLTLDVSFITTAFLTLEPGTCPEDVACGQVYAKLDGDAGNQSELHYNALDWLSPIEVDFSTLDDPAGLHTIALYLQYSDGSPVMVDGAPVMDEITVDVNLQPELTISIPDGSPLRVENDPERSAQIPFNLTNWTLQAPNTCGGAPRCGHIHVHIDGDGGNRPDENFNNIAIDNPADAHFAYVDPIEGEHLITLSLRDDDGNLVLIDEEPVTASVVVDAQESDPTLVVLSPEHNSQVVLDSSLILPVRYFTAAYTLAAPGTCAEEQLPDCGYITAKLDGDSGDKPQRDYNALSFDSPIDIDFSVLDQPYGQHHIKLRVHRNDGSLATVDGENLEVDLDLLVVEAVDPIIYITSPQNGDEVTLGSDPDKTVLVNYNVDNFDIRPPGTCDKPLCGHLYAYVDGDAGNTDENPYNNIFDQANSGVGETYFDGLEDPTGAHTITLSLREDDGDPVMVYGAPVEVTVDIETVTGFANLEILLADNDVVRLLPDSDQTVLLPYRAQNFIVAPPGTCTGEENQACGYLSVEVDGHYLNDTGSNPAQAYLSQLKSPLGQHHFRLNLHYNDGEPVLVDGEAVSSDVTLLVQDAEDPYVRVITPQDGAEATIYSEAQTLAVTFEVFEYLLAENLDGCDSQIEGQEDWGCGYLKLQIDGDAGNQPGVDYNALATSQVPIAADFSVLEDPEGEHTLSLTLFDHLTGEAVLSSLGIPVADTVILTTTLSDNPIPIPQNPTLNLVAPSVDENEDAAPVTLEGDWSLPLYYNTQNITLKEPGTCTEVDGLCGHVEVKIDGNAGNQVGRGYNAQSWASPALADFEILDTPEGLHTVTLTLVDDSGAPIFIDNQPVSEEVVVDVDITPAIRITIPDDTEISVDNSAARAGSIPFQVDNFTLRPPGECDGEARCGHIYLYVDESEGNAPGTNYNSLVFEQPADAFFGYTAAPLGSHQIRMALRRDNGLPYRIDGEDVTDSVWVQTIESIATLNILTPENGAQVPINSIDDPIIVVTYAVDDFTLMDPGTCGAEDNPDCGYVVAKVDGDAGNMPGQTYNAISVDGIAEINLQYLDEPTGSHMIHLSLVDNDGKAVLVDGLPVEDEIEVFTSYFDDPRIRVITPAPEDLNDIPLGTDELMTVPVTYQVSNFTLRPEGQCGSIENCGQLRLWIDGDDGNQPELDYNNLAENGPTGEVDAYFAFLETPTGPHILTLGLVYDGGDPVLIEGQPVRLNVYVNTVEANPTLRILGLADGDNVLLGPDGDQSVFINYFANHFTLREPGTCNGDELDACGYVEITLDSIYNGANGVAPAQVRFGALAEPTGQHTIVLTLKNNDGSDVLVDGQIVRDAVTVWAQANGEPFIQIFTPLEGSDITLLGDDLTSYITFFTNNITLASSENECSAPGNQEEERCAYIVVKIDGDAGNQPRREYNNIWFSPLPAEAYFIYLDEPEGPHTIELILMDFETDEPIIGDISGIPARADVQVNAQLPTVDPTLQ